jgi:DNA-binding response OmpR family regulator
MARIYLVEDNETLREAVTSYLRLNDHEVVEFGRIAGVEDAFRTQPPQLLILDVMLPDGDGFLLARRLRREHAVPIVFLTAKSAESDRITGFELGADDYVVKPFSPRELVLRVEAVLRRTRTAASTGTGSSTGEWLLEEKLLEIDETAHRVKVDARELNLTAAEWKILTFLATHASTVVTRERLLGESLDYLIAEGSERTVDTHVKNVRAKLGHPGWIETVRGFGYRFVGIPSSSAADRDGPK